MSDEREGERRKRLIADLRRIATVEDPEIAHSWADSALLAYINDGEISRAFLQVPRWYA